jgi:hypothetical protein
MRKVSIDFDYLDLSYSKVGDLIFDRSDVFIPAYELFFIEGVREDFLREKFLNFGFVKFEGVVSVELKDTNPYYKGMIANLKGNELDNELFLFGGEHICTGRYFECEIIANECCLILNNHWNLDTLPPSQRT